jgi:hypothetical protein
VARQELEASVEDDVVAWAEGEGWLVRKIQYPGRRGCPDRFFFRDGVLVMIEFKRPGKSNADPLQAREHKRYAAAGWKVHLVNDRDHAKRILSAYD